MTNFMIMVPLFIIIAILAIILVVLRLRRVSFPALAIGLVAAITGLLLGALVSVPLSKLPQPLGEIMPITVSAALTLSLILIVAGRRRSLLAQLPFMKPEGDSSAAGQASGGPASAGLPRILVDTSAIIDGRIGDIAAAGFMPGRLAVPRFVLAELQNIADSDDAMRRGRGRRGLDVLSRLRDLPDLEVEIIEDDVPGIREVDAKLVALAQQFSCNVLTTDYNLNRVAQIQGVRILNVNELSNAIRPVVLPGEEMLVRVVQPGKERNQGVAYLADGTMIVVEDGDKLMGQEVPVEVTRVFQTVAGKMIFAVPRPSPADTKPTKRSGNGNGSGGNHTHTGAPATPNGQVSANNNGQTQTTGQTHQRRGRFDRKPRHQNLEDRVIAAANDAAANAPEPKA